MSAGDAIRKYVSGSGWQTVAPDSGGGSLPAWWTVDSTPGAESVDFGGAVTISPSDPDAIGFNMDVADLKNGSYQFGKLSSDGEEVLSLWLNGFYAKAMTGEGSSTVELSSRDSDVVLTMDSDTGINMRDSSFNTFFTISAEGAIVARATPSIGAGAASQYVLTYDDDDVAPALVVTAKTADGTDASATIPLTPA